MSGAAEMGSTAAGAVGRRPRLAPPGVLVLITVCLGFSGAVRLVHAAPAVAAQLNESREASDEAQGMACPTPDDADSLLAAIRQRSDELDAEEMRVNERMQILTLAEERYQTELAALQEAEEKLAATLALADGAAARDIEQLTAVYENMKPKSAAEIFNAMDVNFAAGFLGNMNPQAAADILSNMTTEAAYSVSLILASRNMNVPVQ